MSLHETIRGELKEALKARDDVRLRTVRGMLTAFTNELVAGGSTPQGTLEDEKALEVVTRLAKQRRESIEQYEEAGRTELAENEKAELAVLESYLPEMLSPEEIRPLAEAKKAELGIEDRSKMGVLIGALMKDLKGKADGNDVKRVVEDILS